MGREKKKVEKNVEFVSLLPPRFYVGTYVPISYGQVINDFALMTAPLYATKSNLYHLRLR